MIRSFQSNDLTELKELYDKYYIGEFDFPDFLGYLCAFVVTDKHDSIITAGGIRTMAEMLLITDKSKGTFTRHRAFNEILHASKFVALRSGFNNINVITKDPNWAKILNRVGFETDEILTMEL